MTTPAAPAAERADWLDAQLTALNLRGPGTARLSALQTEASFRQFYRVSGAKQSLVLMDSPPEKEQNGQFVRVASAFASAGIEVPEVLAHDKPRGFLLLTDLGRTHFIDAYKMGQHQQCLTAACATLETLSSLHTKLEPSIIPPYTQSRLADELTIFVDWLVTRACNLKVPTYAFDRAQDTLLANAADQPHVCVHRDFHCKNLLFNGRDKPIGVLDFQDALIGPAGYDLASLLHDCYWTFSDQVIDQFVEVLPNTNRRNVDLLAVQRQLKAAGIFARLASRDNKTSHLQHIEPVLNSLCRLCSSYTELEALGDWLATTLAPAAKAWVASR